MKHRLTLCYALNLFDLFCTLYWYHLYGVSIEGNPFGRLLLVTNLAIPVKTIGVGAALIALYVGVKKYPKWKWTSWLCLAVYSILAVYHIILLREVWPYGY